MRLLFVTAAITAAVLWAGAPPAGAQQHGLTSDNVEVVRNVPTLSRPNGGRLVGKHFYLTTGTDLTIYDVSDPENPVERGRHEFDSIAPLDLGYLASGYQEDVDTNGKLLIRGDGALQVVDVSNPDEPKEIGRLPSFSQHTVSCVLDCTWVYGSEGAIVDLRDPRNPRLSDADWGASGHDVTEVAPGLVLTATDPIQLLDARHDPEHPKVLAEVPADGFVHGVQWPRAMGDRFVISGGESLGGVCDTASLAEVITWDTTGWQTSGTFKEVDRWHVQPGTAATSGTHPASVWCGHWFDAHPNFRDGGPVAVSWYEQGTRFLEISPDGQLAEVGYFLPHGGSTWAAYWITDRIVYTTDHHRGIDVLRYTGEVPPPGPPAGSPSSGSEGGSAGGSAGEDPSDSPRGGSSPGPARLALADLVDMPSARRCAHARNWSLRIKRRAEDPVIELRLRGRGIRARAISGAQLRRPVRLRPFPRRAFTVRISARTRSGARASGQRRYRICR